MTSVIFAERMLVIGHGWLKIGKFCVKDEVTMGITRISSLFAANVDSIQPKPPQGSESKEFSNSKNPQVVSQTPNSEAVVFASSLSKQNAATQESGKSEASNFERVKQEVQSGNYSRPSEEIAKALVRDLF